MRRLFFALALASCATPPAEAPPPAPAASAAPRPAAAPAPPLPPVAKPKPLVLPAWVDDSLAPNATFPRADAAEAGFDTAALAAIVAEAERTQSDSLLILRDGHTVVERYFGKQQKPIELMSVTKSFASIAVGMLLEEGKIKSVDAPLSTWFPEWKTGRKAKVTLRHVLTHTSGLEHRKKTGVLHKQDDRVKFARESPIAEEPGSRFSYNNEAVTLLSGVIKAAAGKPLDKFLAERLFAPLGITEWFWQKDKTGNVMTSWGLGLTARDLAKVGAVMLAGGTWNEKPVLPRGWVDASTTNQAPADAGCGYLWWVRYEETRVVPTAAHLDELEKRGFTAHAKLRPLAEKTFPARSAAFWMEVGARLSDAERRQLFDLVQAGAAVFEERKGKPMGFAGDGWLGQQLIVLPSRGIVAVRQHREPPKGMATDEYNKKYGFFDLVRLLGNAARPR
jgi:CubicO group peptidase (beta-lactamase class C family)